MTDETPRNAREMTADEYATARAELLREARKAEDAAEKARVMREVEAKFAKKDARK